MKTFGTKKHVCIALRMALAAGVLSIILPAPLSVHAGTGYNGLRVEEESASYNYSDDSYPILTVTGSDSLTISNKDGVGSPVQNIIVIDTNGKTANITLSGVNIDASGNDTNKCAFRIAEGSGPVNITLADGTINTLKSGENCAGLQKETTAEGTMLTISGKGTLNATGGARGAGIGGVHSKDVSYITIDSGTVNAKGGSNAAGIGSGDGWISGFNYAVTNGSHITINGGTVTARDGGSGAAGIGGGSWGNGSDISITGGTVNASSGTGAGIGGGTSLANGLFIGGTGSNISISGGEVTAVSTQGGAGIGGGTGGKGENITISGGTVTATSTFGGAGIGGGSGAIGSGITISGGTVTATDGGSTECGAGIGGGYGKAGTGILITGGTVIATGGKGNNGNGAGIGGGKGSSGSSSTIQPAAGLLATYEGTGTSGTLTNIILNPAQKAYTNSTRYIKICTGSLSSSPEEATVKTGGSQNFIANLSNIANHSNSKITDSVTTYSGNTSEPYNGVSWSVTSNSSSNTKINSSGSLSIGNDESSTPLTVTATLNGTSLTANSRVNVTGIQYTVNFAYNMSGHSGDAATSQTVTSGNKLTTPNVPSVAGYTFSGWYKEQECTNIWDFDADTVTSNRTLYAKWALTTYNIAYELNGGTNVASNPTEYTVLSDNVALASPSKQGNTFTGWTYDAVTTPQLNAIIAKGSTGNKTFTANWAPNTYTVTLEENGGIGTDLTSYTYGTTTVLPTDYKKTGYTFAGWYESQDFSGNATTEISSTDLGEKNYYAKWNLTNYTITYSLKGENMSIFKRSSNKYKGGYSYTVQFPYMDEYGRKQKYSKSGFESKKDAADHERKIRNELESKGKIKKEVSRTLNDLVDEYLRVEKPSMKLNTYLDYSRVYEHHARKTIGNYLIERLEYKDYKQHFNALGDKLGRSTLTQLKSVINNAYIYAIRNSYMEPLNPIQYLKITKYKIRQKKYPKVLTDSQFEQIIDYCSESGRDIAESYQIALYIGYYTGMRKGEILALNKDDVDFVGRTITINKQVIRGEHKDDTMLQLSPKTDASMSKIPIVPQLCDILTDWFKRDPYEIVIPDKEGNYINPDNVTGFCSNMSRILGFHFNFHMLRHTFTTNLIDNGAAPKVVQTLDRHANISTTLNYYDHVSMEKQNEALNDLFGQPEKKLSYKIATNPKS